MKCHTKQIRQIFYSFARSLTTLRNSTASFVTRNSHKLLQQACRPPRHSQASLSPSSALPLQKSKSRISEKVHSRTDKLESPYHPRCGGGMPPSRPTLSVTRTRTTLVHNVYFFLSSTCAWYMMYLIEAAVPHTLDQLGCR